MKFKIGRASNINDVKEIEINTLQDLQILELNTRLDNARFNQSFAEDNKSFNERKYYGMLIDFKEGIIVIDDNNSKVI